MSENRALFDVFIAKSYDEKLKSFANDTEQKNEHNLQLEFETRDFVPV